MLAFGEESVTFCGGYDGCYHTKPTFPTGLALQEMEHFINNLKCVKGRTNYITGITAAYKLLKKHKNDVDSGAHRHSKSVNNNTVF